MKPAESGEERATRQCWECLKRRLVCDHTLPHCKKCIKAGKDCPGYGEQKPLQWIEPGKVTSRRRKKDSPPKVYTIRPRDLESTGPFVASLPVLSSEEFCEFDVSGTITQDTGLALVDNSSEDSRYDVVKEPRVTEEALEIYKSQLAASLVHKENAAWWHSMTAQEQTDHITIMAAKAAAGVEIAQQVMRIGSQKNVRAVIEKGQARENATFLQSDKDPLERLKRFLWIMEVNKLPSYEHLSNETSEVVQAVNYCKSDSPAQAAPTESPSQHQDIPRRQRDGFSGSQSGGHPLPCLGAACLATRYASHPRLLGPQSLHPFAPCGRESRAGCQQSIEDLQISGACDPRPQ